MFADLDACGTQVPSPVLRIDPATNGIQDVLVYVERVERGKAAEAIYRFPMGKGAATSTAQTCQFHHPVFPFVRTAQVGLINFEPVLHNPHFFTEKQASRLTSPCRLPIEKSRPRCPEPEGSGCGCNVMCMCT